MAAAVHVAGAGPEVCSDVTTESSGWPPLGWCLQGKSALNFMHIKSCVSFTELGTVVLYLGVVVIGKNTPPLKISRVK